MFSQRGVGLALGGEAGSRLAGRLGMSTDPDTLPRLVRQTRVEPGPHVHIQAVAAAEQHAGGPLSLLSADLVSEAQARGRAQQACNTFNCLWGTRYCGLLA